MEGQTVSEVFNNNKAALTDCNIEEIYVIQKFAYENSRTLTRHPVVTAERAITRTFV